MATLTEILKLDKFGAIFKNELKRNYLFYDTNEYIGFQPSKVNEKGATPREIYKLGCCYWLGYNIEEDEAQALKFWKIAGNLGEPNAYLELSADSFTLNDNKEGFDYLTKAAEQGVRTAQFRLVYCYLFGIGVEKDEQKAFNLITQLAKLQNADALYWLASIYIHDNGNFVQQNIDYGLELLTRSANKGCKFAEFEQGFLLYSSNINKQDKQNGLEMLKKAADKSEPRAMFVLSKLLNEGIDVEKNQQKALEFLLKSAKSGYQPAINYLNDK